MFVQVIQGKVSDAAQVRAHLDKWVSEVAPGAIGWLGSTGGVTEDGNLIALVRFESEEAAQQNSDRPEQGEWWETMASYFIDEPTFHNSTHVEVDTPGDPAQAGFVQVMQGRTSDPDRARELMAATTPRTGRSSGRTSSAPSRWSTTETPGRWRCTSPPRRRLAQGEQKPPPPEMEQMMKEMDSLMVGETAYFDLKDPWMHAPG